MSNKEKYKKLFIEALNVEEKTVSEDLKYNDVSEWDSIGHMSLIAVLEEVFDIMMDMDDIIDFSSYKKGFEIIAKYGVKF